MGRENSATLIYDLNTIKCIVEICYLKNIHNHSKEYSSKPEKIAPSSISLKNKTENSYEPH